MDGHDSDLGNARSLLSSVSSSVTDWKLVRHEKFIDTPPVGTIHYFYQGSSLSMPKSPTDNRPSELVDSIHNVEVSLRRSPLPMHPNWKVFKDKYGVRIVNGQLRYPEDAEDMYGVQDFLTPVCRYQRTKMSIGWNLPTNHIRDLGTIDTSPEGLNLLFPSMETGTFQPYNGYTSGYWLKSVSESSQHGPDTQITESWDTGGIGGWSDIIYNIQ